MSTEHWFDRLSRPHTRRTHLKTALAAGAALTLPFGRLPSARADNGQLCFNYCLTDAADKFAQADDACNRNRDRGYYSGLLTFGWGIGTVTSIWATAGSQAGSFIAYRQCRNNAELANLKAAQQCEKPSCGDPAKYPGGGRPVGSGPPPVDCPPEYGVLCGGYCCAHQFQCCGGIQCYSATARCPGT
jgi:hypothetical protein